jgi:hypothetical protein
MEKIRQHDMDVKVDSADTNSGMQSHGIMPYGRAI